MKLQRLTKNETKILSIRENKKEDDQKRKEKVASSYNAYSPQKETKRAIVCLRCRIGRSCRCKGTLEYVYPIEDNKVHVECVSCRQVWEITFEDLKCLITSTVFIS